MIRLTAKKQFRVEGRLDGNKAYEQDLSLAYVFYPKMQHCNKANEGKKNKYFKIEDEMQGLQKISIKS